MRWTISGVLHFWNWFVGKTGDFVLFFFFGLQKFEFIEICSHFAFSTHNNKKQQKQKITASSTLYRCLAIEA